MKKCKAVIESSYYGADDWYEFEVEDDATDDQIDDIAWEVIVQNLEWHWEYMEEDE